MKKKNIVHVDTHKGGLRGRVPGHALMAVWITLIGHFFWVSFGQSLWFAWFTIHIWYISESSHVYTCIVNQSGYYYKGIWVGNIPSHNSPVASKEPFMCMCCQGGLLTLGMRGMWSGQGPASCLNCPANLILEFQSVGNESPIALPWQVGGGPPASGGVLDRPASLITSISLGKGISKS